MEICREDVRNTLRILVATDCHLGYMEKDEVRRQDSFKAFDEICSIAEQKKVNVFFVSLFIFPLRVCYICSISVCISNDMFFISKTILLN